LTAEQDNGHPGEITRKTFEVSHICYCMI